MFTLTIYYRATRKIKSATTFTYAIDRDNLDWYLTDYCSDDYIWTIKSGMVFNQPVKL